MLPLHLSIIAVPSGLPRWLRGKESACEIGDTGSFPEEGMATHSSTLAWEIPWTEEPGRLHPWGCRVGHG